MLKAIFLSRLGWDFCILAVMGRWLLSAYSGFTVSSTIHTCIVELPSSEHKIRVFVQLKSNYVQTLSQYVCQCNSQYLELRRENLQCLCKLLCTYNIMVTYQTCSLSS